MEQANFFQKLVRKLFLEDAKFKAETRTKFNVKNIFWLFGIVLAVAVILILLFVPSEFDREVADVKNLRVAIDARSTGDSAGTQNENPAGNQPRQGSFDTSGGIGYGTGNYGNTQGSQTRTRSASQVIRRGQGGNDPGSQIPMGTLIEAKLLTSVKSANSASPVMALITQEVSTEFGTAIPSGTKAIGTATFDDASKRLQLRFSTLVFEDGSQHAVQAVAMMEDGSAGLDGDYDSGQTKRQVGSFIGNFVGGLADGMKERTSGGLLGGAVEPGSIKNGALNGVAVSAQDQAKFYAEDLNATRPSMSRAAGSAFFLFLEKEYQP